ncbi:MAG: molybdopterin molybdotransferase MoeA [Myxococcales bacterium]|nr:molybdopterin molybdotransferase MoeA [Myxococcales bacterium]
MKSIQEALKVMLPAFEPVGVERLPLSLALGRYAGENVFARSDLPSFSNSAMDGYAVRWRDIEGASETSPRLIPLQGMSKAGGEIPPPLRPGSGMRIFTGAMVPAGADAVVIQEHTRLLKDEQKVEFLHEVAEGANIRMRGSNLSAGATILQTGLGYGPGEIGLLAAQGYAQVTAYRRPRVAILSTGDELRDVAEPLLPGQIINSNVYALAAMVSEAGGEPEILPNAPDSLEVIVERLKEGARADCLLISGGVSVGDYDYVREAFERCDVRADFWKVRIKPGKPLTFGLQAHRPVVGLPGNPVSAMVTFEVFVRPCLRKMLGDSRPFRVTHQVELVHAHRHSPGRPELARAFVSMTKGDHFEAKLHAHQESGAMTSMVGTNALVLLNADDEHFPAGSKLPAILLRDQNGSSEPPFSLV